MSSWIQALRFVGAAGGDYELSITGYTFGFTLVSNVFSMWITPPFIIFSSFFFSQIISAERFTLSDNAFRLLLLLCLTARFFIALTIQIA